MPTLFTPTGCRLRDRLAVLEGRERAVRERLEAESANESEVRAFERAKRRSFGPASNQRSA